MICTVHSIFIKVSLYHKMMYMKNIQLTEFHTLHVTFVAFFASRDSFAFIDESVLFLGKGYRKISVVTFQQHDQTT